MAIHAEWTEPSMVKIQWKIVGERKPEAVGDVVRILLENRGLGPSFLDGSLGDLEAHLCIRGMDEGAELMARHLSEGGKIVLVGDYDCDGITSLAQMSLFLREIGYYNFEVVVPRRSEGYGIPMRAVLDHPGTRLVVAMDCGTLDVAPVSLARERGMDCIVIDHHEVPGKGVAPATVLINPKHPECGSTFKEFCSSGLTLLFLARLRRAVNSSRRPSLGGKYLILAAMGTVSDIVPLVEGNRIITRSGLHNMNSRCYPAARQLVKTAGLSGKPITAGHLGFYIGPRINAAGRMADGRAAYELLVEEEPAAMVRLAEELNRLNSQRQREEDLIVDAIRLRLADKPAGKKTLVVGDPLWPAGIIGIVASRIQQELHYGPVIVFSVDEEAGIARGSARSVQGFDIHRALRQCDDLLLKWGGHKMAAGMTLSLAHMDEFTRRFEESACDCPDEVFLPRGKADMELDLALISRQLVEELKRLEPHGFGNPAPIFASRQVKVRVRKAFGRARNHLRLVLNNGIEGIFWKGVQHYQTNGFKDTESLDVVYQVEWDEFNGKPVVSVRDLGRLFR